MARDSPILKRQQIWAKKQNKSVCTQINKIKGNKDKNKVDTKLQLANGSAGSVSKSDQMFLNLKIRIFNTKFKQTFSDAKPEEKQLQNKLSVFINKSTRFLLRFQWQKIISNRDLWKGWSTQMVNLQHMDVDWTRFKERQ